MTPASGPGIVMMIRDPQAKHTAAMLLDALQELVMPGAEAVQINDGRVGASTRFADGASGQDHGRAHLVPSLRDHGHR